MLRGKARRINVGLFSYIAEFLVTVLIGLRTLNRTVKVKNYSKLRVDFVSDTLGFYLQLALSYLLCGMLFFLEVSLTRVISICF